MRYLVIALVCLGMSTADAQVFHLRGTKIVAPKAPVAAVPAPAAPVAARAPAPRVTAQPASRAEDTPRPKKKAPKKTRKSSDDDDVVIVEDE